MGQLDWGWKVQDEGKTQSWVSHSGTEAPWWLREMMQASRAGIRLSLTEEVITRKRKIERHDSRNIRMLNKQFNRPTTGTQHLSLSDRYCIL